MGFERRKTRENKMFTIALGLLILIMAGLLAFGMFYMPKSDFKVEKAHLDLTGYQRFDWRMIYLEGEWEYYPDQLLCTEEIADAVPAGYISMPTDFLTAGLPLPQTGAASFRLMLENIPRGTLMMFSIPGYLGEYTIYLDGDPFYEATAQVMSPNYYQYAVVRSRGASEPVELVLEMDQPNFAGIDCMPILSDTDLQFNNFFVVRLVFFVLFGLMLAAFVIIPVTYRVHKQAELRIYACIGFGSLLLFLLEAVWFSGFLDTVQRVVSLQVIQYISMFLATALCYGIYCFIRTVHQIRIFRLQDAAVRILYSACMAAAFALAVLGYPVLYSETALTLCVVPGLCLTAALMLVSVRRHGLRAFLPAVGFLALATGMLFKGICPYAKSMLACQMVFPMGLVVNLICWSLLITENRKRDIAALEKALTTEKNLARTQAAFLASQIQPHFLYNTLTTIQELCYSDPELAADTVLHFASYLRQNIDFMDYKDKVPFEQERKHIDNYIQIQRARFEDAVNFVLEINTVDFMLPPLTVQPLIENAVSHGVRKDRGHGTVRLVTRREEDNILIIVEDDGVGFDVANARVRSLENIRSRIETIMHGSMEIDSRPGAGTRVTLHFPYEEAVFHANHDR